MHVVSKKTLAAFWRNHVDAEAVLEAWFKEAKAAQWKTPKEIRARFSSVDFLPENRVVFNLGGNKYRLVVKTTYVPGTIYVRFIGTHAEYDKIDAETI